MRTYKHIYPQICNLSNLILAWRKARKGKTKKHYVMEFEKDTIGNLLALQEELKNQTYSPKPLITFILRDPKTRKISKADFRDRIVHHAIVRILEPIFDKTFIYDSCANRKRKGNLFAIKRFKKFIKKVSRNGKTNGWFNINQVKGYCLKADIKHYFEEVNHEILLSIIKRKIKDEKVIWLINKILKNSDNNKKGMPLGNLTSQFFANIYLNELDYFVKHKLKAKYYVRYVDDFVLLNNSKAQLKLWMEDIEHFLIDNLNLELHKQKSKIIPLSRGIDFVGFRNFYYYRLVRTRNIRNIRNKINDYKKFKISYVNILDSFQGWQAYAMWADCYNLINKLEFEIN
ncbi:MAG: reverse transcriptase domain-containing protein [Candidatus Pacearchaeota archaeon]